MGKSKTERYELYKETLTQGHEFRHIHTPYRAKAGSHDDGPDTGLFLGGIGAPACSRDLTGSFARWHLESGSHIRQEIDEAFLGIRWSWGGRSGYFRLSEKGIENTGIRREVYSLFPVTRESYHGPELPFQAEVEFFSPLVPGDNQASTLPVWYATVHVKNTGDKPLEIDAAVFMPNFLGWINQRMTSLDRPSRSWPSQTHGGNTARPFEDHHGRNGVIQQRFPERSVRHNMEGEIAIISHGGSGQRSSREVCYKSGQNCIDRKPENQKYTVAWVEHYFSQKGTLPGGGEVWRAHWDEAIGSAVSRGGSIKAGETEMFEFCAVYDMPLVEFGSNRVWYRKYTEEFGKQGRSSVEIALFAIGNKEQYREKIDRWQKSCLLENDHLPPKLKAAMINELYFLNGGGSVWVTGCKNQSDLGMEPPLLGDGEHAAILEGYDTGYYYYNTSDLWPYAWYAISRWWPEFSDLVFNDYIKTIPMEIETEHIIYRSEEMAPILVPGKLPHDIGTVMSDPWHDINGYQMRDDSNLWKDHNPGFIISFYLHKQLLGLKVTAEEWAVLREAGRFVMDQDDDLDGLPYHDAFGDSTWDNLGIQGRASYSGSLTIAGYAVLSRLAYEHGDRAFEHECTDRLIKAQKTFSKYLWNGEYFKLSDTGRYSECIMSDGIMGFFLADLAGLSGYIKEITRKDLISHLKAVYQYNFRNYENGTEGPLLVAERDRTEFPGDGGDELQVNEVLIGSAWMTVAMMYHYGLKDQADEISSVMMHILHDISGMQFKTPAAYSSRKIFRAPMNMRPLSIWFLDSMHLKRRGESPENDFFA